MKCKVKYQAFFDFDFDDCHISTYSKIFLKVLIFHCDMATVVLFLGMTPHCCSQIIACSLSIAFTTLS